MWDRLWWLSNRKPVGKRTPYWATVLVGFCAGIIAFPSLVLLPSYRDVDKWWLGFVFLGLSLLLVVGNYFWDKAHGYVDAMYSAYLQHREKIGKRLGKL